MNNSTNKDPALQQRFAEIFARLPEEDIERFYAHYQLWLLRRRVPVIEGQIAALQAHLAENQRLIKSLQPTAVALAVLARLQLNGVSNVELLDQMLERGEVWLDKMMQRLDYCEQVEDFIQGDYTEWCFKSLEGAYDWIDTLLVSTDKAEVHQEPGGAEAEATEELLLQKLSQDGEEEEQDITLKQSAVPSGQAVESASIPVPGVQESIEEEEIPLNAAEQSLRAKESDIREAEEGEFVSGSEQPAELATWEDLEAPPGRPAPWYSVNLAEGTPSEATQPEAMNDWIEVLQADTAHIVAAGEPEIAEAGSTESVVAATSSTEVSPSESIDLETKGSSGEEIAVRQPEEVLGTGESQSVPEIALEASEAPMAEAALCESETLSSPDEEEVGTSDEMHPLAEDEAARFIDEDIAAPPVNEPDSIEAAEFQVENVQEARESAAAGNEPELAAMEINGAQEPEGAIQGQEAEEAVIVNDVLSPEEEQRPWYDYLEIDKHQIAMHDESEKGASVSPDDSSAGMVLELQECAAVDENAAGPASQEEEFHQSLETDECSREASLNGAPAHAPGVILQEAEDGGESRDTAQDNDTTLPMALKDIQKAREALLHTASASRAENGSEAGLAMLSELEASEETPESMAPEQIIPAQDEINEAASVEEGEVDISETLGEVLTEDRITPEPNEPAAPSTGPMVQSALQVESRSEEQQKKRGFWQRLFGWMGKK